MAVHPGPVRLRRVLLLDAAAEPRPLLVHAGHTRCRRPAEWNGHQRSLEVLPNRRSSSPQGHDQAPPQEAGQSSSLRTHGRHGLPENFQRRRLDSRSVPLRHLVAEVDDLREARGTDGHVQESEATVRPWMQEVRRSALAASKLPATAPRVASRGTCAQSRSRLFTCAFVMWKPATPRTGSWGRSLHTAEATGSKPVTPTSCSGDDCPSSGLYGSLGFVQVRLGGGSVQCSVVRSGTDWWSD